VRLARVTPIGGISARQPWHYSRPLPSGGALDQPAIVWRPLRPPQAGSGKASLPN